MKHFDVYRIVTTVYSRSAKAFETLKRRVLWCSLVLFTSEVFAKKKQRSWSSHGPKVCGVFVDGFPLPLTMYMLYSYMLHDEIVHT